MGKANSLVGDRYGKLAVVKRVANAVSGASQWHCECDCGGHAIVRGDNLKGGRVVSCGCARVGRTPFLNVPAETERAPEPSWLGPNPGNEFVQKIMIYGHDSRAYSSDGVRSYGFGWCKGVDLNGAPLGGHPDVGVFSKLLARQRRQGPVHVIAIRTMDMLGERGLIMPRGTRSYAQWMIDNGVAFHIGFRGDTNAIEKEYRELGGFKQWPVDQGVPR